LIGAQEFFKANICLAIVAVLAIMAWTTRTLATHTANRSLRIIGGFVVITLLAVVAAWWTDQKKVDAARQDAKIEQLNLLPELQEQVKQIPKQQAELLASEQLTFEAQKQIAANIKNGFATLKAQGAKTQTQIVGLGHMPGMQAGARSNTTAGSKIRRTLGNAQDIFIDTLKAAAPQDIAITIARSPEAADFGSEIVGAFEVAGWNIKPSRLYQFLPEDAVGVKIVQYFKPAPTMGQFVPLTGSLAAIAQAFRSAGIEPEVVRVGVPPVPLEMYIGLQEPLTPVP